MILATFLARASDGLLLAEHSEDVNEILNEAKRKIKIFLKNPNMREQSTQLKCLEIGNYILDYKTEDGVVIMVLCDKKYPTKLANIYLGELFETFREHFSHIYDSFLLKELKRQYGTQAVDYRSKIETIDEPYKFLGFERQIKKIKIDFQDVRTNANIERLKNDITNVHNIMAENIDLILNRGNKLEDAVDKTRKLKEESKRFKGKAKEVELTLMLRHYSVYIIMVLLLSLFVYFKFFQPRGFSLCNYVFAHVVLHYI